MNLIWIIPIGNGSFLSVKCKVRVVSLYLKSMVVGISSSNIKVLFVGYSFICHLAS